MSVGAANRRDVPVGGVPSSSAPKQPVRGVLFDIDDTLVDTKASFRAGVVAAAAEFLPGRDGDELLQHWRADVEGRYRAYTRGELGYHEQRMMRVNRMQRDFGGPALTEADYRRWSQLFDDAFQSSWRVHADVADCLAQLAGAGIGLGAVTNASGQLQTVKLAAVGLSERVPLLVSLDTLGFGKPAPEVFWEGCRLLGTEPGATVYVGDEFDADAQGAQRAGLVGVWLDRQRAADGAQLAAASGVHYATDLVGLPDLVGAAFGSRAQLR